ncbi:MAG: hypothetical protein REI78_12815 [Pedobacter sp.]|nr:hypothetical protein [Pedobacter sp.]
MPDKDFDQLFRDKFEGAEIEPSRDLWANIEQELVPQKKRTFPIYWMAAATVVVAIGAVLMFQKKEVIQLRGNNPIAVVQPKTEMPTGATAPKTEVEPVAKTGEVAAKTAVINNTENKQVPAVVTSAENKPQNIQLAVQPNQNEGRLPIKQQDPKPIDVLPIKEVPVDNQKMIANEPVAEKIDESHISEAGSTERKGIRNVGDLVNYVVDKVDKRDKKLVRFNTDDDDNSSIVGINIGFFKFNKKNKDR